MALLPIEQLRCAGCLVCVPNCLVLRVRFAGGSGNDEHCDLRGW